MAAVRDLWPCPGGRWRERFDASERWRGMPARSTQNKFTPDFVNVQGPRRHDHRLAWRLGIGASDYAVTADAGDLTAHGVAGVDPDDNL